MQNHSFLLVDDDADDRDIFIEALQDANKNADCITASDCGAALEMLEKQADFRPDYIFLDLNMPSMHGKKCLEEIKKIARANEIPVVIYTTSSYERDVEDTKKLGAAHFLVKPASMASLTNTLKDFLENRSMPFLLNHG